MVLKAKSKELNINKLKSEIKRFELEREIIKSESERVNKVGIFLYRFIKVLYSNWMTKKFRKKHQSGLRSLTST